MWSNETCSRSVKSNEFCVTTANYLKFEKTLVRLTYRVSLVQLKVTQNHTNIRVYSILILTSIKETSCNWSSSKHASTCPSI